MMKVTVRPDGEVVFDTEDVSQALDMIKALRNGHSKPEKKKRLDVGSKAEKAEEVALSAPLMETWNYMVATGASSGLSVHEVANGLNLQTPTAQYRINQLVKKGLAHRVSLGMYAPGEASE